MTQASHKECTCKVPTGNCVLLISFASDRQQSHRKYIKQSYPVQYLLQILISFYPISEMDSTFLQSKGICGCIVKLETCIWWKFVSTWVSISFYQGHLFALVQPRHIPNRIVPGAFIMYVLRPILSRHSHFSWSIFSLCLRYLLTVVTNINQLREKDTSRNIFNQAI